MALETTATFVNDLSRLRPYWHPVAMVSEVTEKPLGVRLLNEDLVLWRSRDGSIRAFKDLCIHRGSMLSLGRVNEDGQLVCAYHGWTYNTEGACTYIPAQPREKQRIPTRAKTVTYRAVEHIGLVWVALDEPCLPIAELPEYDDPEFRVIMTYRSEIPWKASAARVIENFMDLAHVPVVHGGLLRNATETEIDDYSVEVDEKGIVSTYDHPGSSLTVGDKPEEPGRQDWLRFPFTGGISLNYAKGRVALLLTVQPISERESMLWKYRARNLDLDKPDGFYIELDTAVIEQDREMVEGQRPEMLPVDLTEELHIKGPDAASVEYRRMLKRKTGLLYA